MLKGSRLSTASLGKTVRPHAFIKYGVLRKRLSWLKLLGSISGRFVGVGLFLTFIGIVMALNMADNDQTGWGGDLIKQFPASVQGGAGAELKQLGTTLQQMQETLARTQGAMNDTGADFTRRLSDAADNLNRLVTEAGSQLGAGAEASRSALQEVVESLRATFEIAKSKPTSATQRPAPLARWKRQSGA